MGIRGIAVARGKVRPTVSQSILSWFVLTEAVFVTLVP
jgi:hypothetical protein